MFFNNFKYNTVSVSLKYNKYIFKYDYGPNGVDIPILTSFWELRVTFGTKLSFNNYVQLLADSSFKIQGFLLQKSGHFLDISACKIFYEAFGITINVSIKKKDFCSLKNEFAYFFLLHVMTIRWCINLKSYFFFTLKILSVKLPNNLPHGIT